MITAARIAVVAALAGCRGKDAACPPAVAAVQIHTFKPAHGPATTIARRVAEHLQHDPSGPRPDWVLVDPTTRAVVFVGDDAGYHRALEIARSYDDGAPDPGPDRRAARRSSGSARPASVDGIQQVDPTHYEIERATVDKILANPTGTARGARIVPAVKNGMPYGFKLYAVRPRSVYAALGLENGDAVVVDQRRRLASATQALRVYSHVRYASKLDVAITRRGQDLVLHYTIK